MTTTIPTPATQVTRPWTAAFRTILQTVAGAILGSVVVVAAIATVAPQILDAVAAVLPPAWLAWATGAVATIGALAGAFARVMAIPGVNAWLTKLKLAA
jgi:ADP-ribosylglycohydrolase